MTRPFVTVCYPIEPMVSFPDRRLVQTMLYIFISSGGAVDVIKQAFNPFTEREMSLRYFAYKLHDCFNNCTIGKSGSSSNLFYVYTNDVR